MRVDCCPRALDPVGAGYVASLARPGGNATGFASVEFGLSAKLLELLKQIAPRVAGYERLRGRRDYDEESNRTF
jgi:hypothetical protein